MPSPEAIDETPAPLAILLDNHRAFLNYLQGRVGDRELAEDILQEAFIKVMDRPEQAPASGRWHSPVTAAANIRAEAPKSGGRVPCTRVMVVAVS